METESGRIIDRITQRRDLELSELEAILSMSSGDAAYLYGRAREVADSIYGKRIFIRGLIEFTNYCINDCYYCGIRKGNKSAERYRLDKEQILECCREGYGLGFRTFVLQGGEDPFFSDDRLCEIVREIKACYPECAVTLSVGERSRESYEKLHNAGADRYLLRHETACEVHYRVLHPERQQLKDRLLCLRNLKEIGYQTGCGFMVGSPGQSVETLYKDLRLIKELKPHMVGIGPFIPQKDTPFAKESPGTAEQTLRLLSVIRLIHPHVLLPATTALGSIHPEGREMGILAGANVVMPNLSPVLVRGKYSLYDNKLHSAAEAAENLSELKSRMQSIGYEIAMERGDYVE